MIAVLPAIDLLSLLSFATASDYSRSRRDGQPPLKPAGRALVSRRDNGVDGRFRAVENALQLDVPLNAQYIRNLILIAHALHDHVVHFYHLSALDWVDITSALKADPKKTSALAESLSPWTRNGYKEMTAVKERVANLVAGGQLGIFTNGYWGHPAYKLPPEANRRLLPPFDSPESGPEPRSRRRGHTPPVRVCCGSAPRRGPSPPAPARCGTPSGTAWSPPA